MPIGDLLAEISGGDPSPAPPPKSSTPASLKRKAEDDSHSATSVKLTKSRQQDGSYSASRVTRDVKGDTVERSKTPTVISTKTSSLPHRTSSSSTNGRYQPPVPNGQRTTTGTASSNGRPVAPSSSSNAFQTKHSNSAPRPKLSSSSLAAASKVPPAKPSPTTPTALDPSKAPKKGSYQEIMERAKKAQATMGKVGMIQHKAMESKKERPGKTDQKPGVMKGKDGKPYRGNGRTGAAPSRGAARPGMAARGASQLGAAKDMKAGSKSRPNSSGGEALEKKIKKSATATTGYTGTARPRPGAVSKKPSSSKKGPSSSYKPGGLLAPPKPSHRDRYEEEYDEELDDFIDYDDDEDGDPRGAGPGYGYDSDASSDMEAGMSDIDVEERRAEKLAMEEDKREKALEEKLKREKEERRRRLTQNR
ncbi:hypothetical protein F4677DRAFT_421824 [Hypoxylon crocopeplum]|nr:hypothetical protein F4677DRAFT_421824 [Hypoxylon crocopeplum]